MIAKDLISVEISPLKTSNSGDLALEQMANYYVRHLPIVNETSFLGTICEEDILNHDAKEPIGSYSLQLNRAFVREHDHVLDIIKKISDTGLSIIPVVDKLDIYKGLITQEEIISFLASNFSFAHSGGIIVIETDRKNYSLSEITRILESEGMIILATFVSLNPDSTNVLVTIKIKQEDTFSIEQVLERFDYNIIASFSKNEMEGHMQQRYDSLMKFLEV